MPRRKKIKMSEKAKEELKRRAQGCGKHSQSISTSEEEHSNIEDEDEKLPHSRAFKKLQPFLHLGSTSEGSSDDDMTTGYRVVDIQCLESSLVTACVCGSCRKGTCQCSVYVPLHACTCMSVHVCVHYICTCTCMCMISVSISMKSKVCHHGTKLYWKAITHLFPLTLCCALSNSDSNKLMILYRYHHSTKLYRKISLVCCRLYCYDVQHE